MDEGGPAVPRVRVWLWRVWTAIGVVLGVGAVLWALRGPLGVVVAPLALAGLIVYLLNPAVTALARRRVPRLLATAVAYLLGIGVVAGSLTLVGPIVAEQAGAFLNQVPDILTGIQEALNSQLRRMGLPAFLEFDLGDTDTQQAIAAWFAENREQLLTLLGAAGSVLTRAFHLLLVVVLAPMLAFYALVDWPNISAGFRRLVPPDHRTEIVDVGERIGVMVGAYFRGQLLVAAFVGVATSIGLAIVGLPFWALVGLTAGLFNLVPLIGPFVGGLIGVVIALTVGGGLGQAIAVVIVMVLVQQVDNHVITPNIMARTVRVHPITVILALLVAGTMFGILGMFVAIPAVAAVKLVTMYVLVTRVPSMRHLAGEGGALFDDTAEPPPNEPGLVAMGRELRSAWERRRWRGDTHATDARDPHGGHGAAGPLPDDLASAPPDPAAAGGTAADGASGVPETDDVHARRPDGR